jgi:hypothetical protein
VRAPNAAEWQQILTRQHRARLHPFDGRKADYLLAVAIFLSSTTKGTRVVLKATREVFGERTTRRYVPYLVDAGLLEMVVKPARAKNGKAGRMAVYEFRRGLAETLPQSPHEVGSENYDQSGQRSCSARIASREGDSCSTLPTSTLEASFLFTSAAANDGDPELSVAVFDTQELISLASRSGDWAGWQVVASLIPLVCAA